MNVSPFKNATEFLEADGAIYSFSSPGQEWFLYLMTALSAAIMIYLVVKAYTIKHD